MKCLHDFNERFERYNMKKSGNPILRVGIAGQGRSGYKIHAMWLKQAVRQYRIAAVADQLPERRRDAQREFGARAYADYATMIRKGGFDLFVNALPTPLHAQASIEALKAGFDVVCEKPFAGAVKDVDRMAAAARRANRLLAPFQNNRLQPFFDKIQEVIQSGVLGEIVHIRSIWGGFSRRWDWQTLRRNLGGILFNTGPHALDQALTLIGWDKTPRVFCRMTCRHELGGDADDFCSLTLHGKNMPTVDILLTSCLAYAPRHVYTIGGTRGTLIANADEVLWKYYDAAKAPRQKFWKKWSVKREYPRENLPWIEKQWSLAENKKTFFTGYTLRSYQIGTRRFYDNIYDVLVKGAGLIITVPQVRKQIAVIEACRRQAWD